MCTHTHTQPAAGGGGGGMVFVTSSAGQEHHLRKKDNFFTIITFPNIFSYRAPSPFGKFTSSASKIWTRCRLLLPYCLILPYFPQSLVAVWKDRLPATSFTNKTGQRRLCRAQGHPARGDAARPKVSPGHLPPGPQATTGW